MIVVPDTGRVRHRTLELNPGETLVVEPDDWADTLLIVLSGDLELLCCSGRRAVFATGALLTLAGLPVLTLRNPGPRPLIVHAVSRRPEPMTT